jgi:hypothetical protein
MQTHVVSAMIKQNFIEGVGGGIVMEGPPARTS